jgi:hypothetical protein
MGTGYFFVPSHLLMSFSTGRPRGRMVLSSPKRLAILLCQSVSPKGLWRLRDSRIEASWSDDSGSSPFLIQLDSTSTGQASANSLRTNLTMANHLLKLPSLI